MQHAPAPSPNSAGTATFAELVSALPSPVRKYLLSRELAKRRTALYAAHTLTEDERYTVLHTELETFFGELPLTDFPDDLWTRLGWEDARAADFRALVVDILGNVFLSAQDHVGDVGALIADFGGDATRFAIAPIEKRTLTYDEGVQEITRSMDASAIPPDMRKRMAHIVEMRLRDLHDDLETRDMLMKSRKTGGMELDAAMADRIVSAIAARSTLTQYVDGVAQKPTAAPTTISASASILTASAGASAANAWTPERVRALYVGDEEERRQIAQLIEKFLKVTEEDPEKMIEAASEVVAPPDGRVVDTELVVAVLSAVAEQGFLRQTCDDPRIVALVDAYRATAGIDGPLETDDARMVSTFLQVALRGTASLDDAESARFGMRLVNAAKRAGDDEYADLTYFDAVAGAFRWRDPIKT